MKKIEELEGKIFISCSACMSVYADALSYVNASPENITSKPEEASNIIILSCQVTDLAILNDFNILDKYKKLYPDKKYFISGCLPQRLDIPMPDGVERLELPRCNYEKIYDKRLIYFEKPFWSAYFVESNDEKEEFEQGHLFRNMYPLRIGKGCPNKCSFCTIRFTRGAFEEYSATKLEQEFQEFDNVVLVADSPTAGQIKDWCEIAHRWDKPISIRNVEPDIVVKCEEELIDLAAWGLLKVFHSPIQSTTLDILIDMGRGVKNTYKSMAIVRELRVLGVFTATNIIIDYKNFPNDTADLSETYDYVSWNPYWDGVWDEEKAKKRMKNYITGE